MFEFKSTIKNNLTKKSIQPSSLEFTVMPQLKIEDNAQVNPVPNIKQDMTSRPRLSGTKVNWYKFIWILFAIIIILVFGYFIYTHFDKNDSEGSDLNVDSIVVPKSNTTENVALDTDQDGLHDQLEGEELFTDQKNPDTDGDGLSDGDEVNIYSSDPLLFDTDSDTFNDGSEVSRGYSPLQNSPEKATTAETGLWNERIQQFGLHEPSTKTIAGEKTPSSEAGTNEDLVYANKAFGYILSYPQVLAFREAEGGLATGFYVQGALPPDEDVSSDLIFSEVLTRIGTQSLEDWIAENYTFSKLTELTVNNVPGVQIIQTSEHACKLTKTFFQKDNRLIVISLNSCSEVIKSVDTIYHSMIKSFKFSQ